ncbi:MAG: hypothetical protein IJ484_02885 [Oscillospiraceae bacterium]|nr:hypothetical protein [Oscillospiraceae bacterium]
MIFWIEAVLLCLLFHLLIWLAFRKKQTAFVNDYPPIVTERLRALGLIAQKPPARKQDVLRKLAAVVVYAALFALLLRTVNGIDTFREGTLTAYGLWLVVDWYDFLVMDVLCASTDRFYRAAGVGAFEPSSVWFHFKGSLRGMLIGLVAATVVGLLVML